MKDNRNYTNFGKFIARMGVRKLGLEMDSRGQTVSAQSIHYWLRGVNQPEPKHARLIVEIAGEKEAELGYKLTFEDIYNHAEQMKVSL